MKQFIEYINESKGKKKILYYLYLEDQFNVFWDQDLNYIYEIWDTHASFDADEFRVLFNYFGIKLREYELPIKIYYSISDGIDGKALFDNYIKPVLEYGEDVFEEGNKMGLA